MLNQRIYTRLQEVAKAQTVTTYQEVGSLVGRDMSNDRDREWLAGELGEISEHEVGEHHPMLSAVVINARYNIPGRGFFSLARDLGKLEHTDHKGNVVFFARELLSVHDYWSRR